MFWSRSFFLPKGLQRFCNRKKPQWTGKSSDHYSLLISCRLPLKWVLHLCSRPADWVVLHVSMSPMECSVGLHMGTVVRPEAIKKLRWSIIWLVNFPTIGKIHLLLQLVLQVLVVRKWRTSGKSAEPNGFVIVPPTLHFNLGCSGDWNSCPCLNRPALHKIYNLLRVKVMSCNCTT